jgi:hypothetical protein
MNAVRAITKAALAGSALKVVLTEGILSADSVDNLLERQEGPMISSIPVDLAGANRIAPAPRGVAPGLYECATGRSLRNLSLEVLAVLLGVALALM